MRFRKRTDENQKGILQTLKKIPGVSVADLSNVGNGMTDIIVGYRKMNFLLEIKNPNKDLNQRKLTPAQKEFFETWKGQKDVIETADDALRILGIL